MAEHTQHRSTQWISFIGFILLLVGIYGSVRTLINIAAFEKYPQNGVFNLSFFPSNNMMPMVYQREQDCMLSGQQMYYDKDMSTPRPPTDEEKRINEQQQESCIESVKEARNSAKVNDISQSLLFLFLGGGILGYRRFFNQ